MSHECDLTELRRTIRDLEGRVEALNRARLHHQDRIDDLEATNERLRERIGHIEELVDPDPGATEYHQLTKPQKVHRLRRTLTEQAATQRNGKARMTYREVMMLFDGHPSAGHCYDLMERAAELDGFAYDTPGDGGQKRVRVKIDGVNDETLLHAVNNARDGGTA